MSGTVVVFGGRSEIGVAIAERLAPTASVVVLAVRPGSDAGAEAERVRAAGAARVEGDPRALQALLGLLTRPAAGFPIVTR